MACLGGFIYVAGGRDTSQTNVLPLRSVYRYDPRLDVWLRVSDMINARESFQLAVLDGKVYAVGKIIYNTIGAYIIYKLTLRLSVEDF